MFKLIYTRINIYNQPFSRTYVHHYMRIWKWIELFLFQNNLTVKSKTYTLPLSRNRPKTTFEIWNESNVSSEHVAVIAMWKYASTLFYHPFIGPDTATTLFDFCFGKNRFRPYWTADLMSTSYQCNVLPIITIETEGLQLQCMGVLVWSPVMLWASKYVVSAWSDQPSHTSIIWWTAWFC